MFKRIGVIGAGAMGRGIAQLFASSGQQVLLFDTRAEAIEDALAFNRNLLQRAQAKGKLTEAETFRIGCIGDVDGDDMASVVTHIEEITVASTTAEAANH